jgi:hypothetical protein
VGNFPYSGQVFLLKISGVGKNVYNTHLRFLKQFSVSVPQKSANENQL